MHLSVGYKFILLVYAYESVIAFMLFAPVELIFKVPLAMDEEKEPLAVDVNLTKQQAPSTNEKLTPLVSYLHHYPHSQYNWKY